MTTDWNKVLEYLQPKMPPFCPEEPSVNQKVFLRTNSMEALFGGAAGGGKMELISNLLPTPSGFKLMGDIHPGDEIFGMDGLVYVVLAESAIRHVEGYKFTFDDGSEVTSNDEHLWLTYDATELEALTKRTPEFREKRRSKRESRSLVGAGVAGGHTTAHREFLSDSRTEWNKANQPPVKESPQGTVRTVAQIVATLTVRNGRANHAIPVAKPLQLPHKNLLVDPYVLGAWLGDGSKSAPLITSMDDSIVEAIEAAGYSLTGIRTRVNSKASSFYFGGRLLGELRSLNLMNDKHIPHDYLWASEKQRLSLLQGLMDTDGNCLANGTVEFVNTNQRLTEGVAHLARSLGHKVNVREGRAKLNGKDCGPVWKVKFRAKVQVFRLPRKAERLQPLLGTERRTTNFRYIVSAERITNEPMKCIQVSADNGIYLTSENFIPTHNSSALLMSALQYVDIPNYSAILFRRTFADLSLPGALMDRFKSWINLYDDVHWNNNSFVATFPSGARVSFGYLNNAGDFLRYKGCLPRGTEVLTFSGWRNIEDIEVGESIASMNPATREWDYQTVTHTWTYDHDGPIYGPRDGSDVSFAATDNHTWWTSTPRVEELKKYRTDELPKVARFPQAGKFVGGIEPDVSLFPRSLRGHQNSSDLIFNAEDWATFLGWYIAEGCTSKGTVQISLHDKHSRGSKNSLSNLLEKSGSHVRDTPRRLTFTNSKLASWLDENTGKGAYNKRIPDEVFTWKTEYSRLLLESLVEGDGTWRTPNSGHYVTVSRELADGVMRLAQHCGFRATLDERQDRTVTPDGKEHDVLAFHVYLLYKADSDTGISLGTDSEPIVSTHYKGTVHCVTVPPHHTFLIRHNGRVVWTGNSEFQFIGMDEVTEIRESDYRYLFSRLRRPSSGPLSRVPLRMRAASNPAPNWVRQRFIVEGLTTGRIFVPSKLTDNPGIDAASYRQALQALDPIERRRLEEGDWWSTSLGTLFDRTSVVILDSNEIPQITSSARAVRFWDLAATEPSHGNPNPDYTVGTLMLFDQGIGYVLDVKRFRVKGEKVEQLIAQTAYEDGHGVPIRMEQEPGSSGKALADQYARYVVPGYDFGAIRSTGDKVTRARPLAAAAANGNLRVVRGPWLTEWLDEFSSFPEACDHDDQVDSAVGAFTHLAGLGLPQRRPVSIII